MREREDGAITVFLSLILLLILAIIMTTIEASRVNAVEIISDRAMMTAMDSCLAEYYSPLFEEYHIFGLDGGYGSNTIDKEVMAGKLKSYMEYTFIPDKDLEPISYLKNPFQLYGIKNTYINISKTTSMFDYEGDLFVKQGVDYEKYKATSEILNKLLHNLSDLEDTKESRDLLEEKQKVETSTLKVDEKVLKLMEEIDGIKVTNKGIKTDGEKIAVKDYFVKKLWTQPVTKEALHINNDWVFESLKSEYYNPNSILEDAAQEIDELIRNKENLDNARINYLYLSLTDVSNMSEEEKEEHEVKLANARSKYDSYENKQSQLIDSLNVKGRELKNAFKGISTPIDNAIDILKELIPLKQQISKEITDYAQILEANKNLVSEDFYNQMVEQLNLLSKYKNGNEGSGGMEDTGYDFNSMLNTLLKDQDIMAQVNQSINLSVTSNVSTWDNYSTTLDMIKRVISGFDYNGLNFDYSTLSKPVESDSFFQGIKNTIDNGILGLVVEDTSTISSKEISDDSLPTQLNHIDSSGLFTDITDIFLGLNLENGEELLNNILGNDEDITKLAAVGADNVMKTLLFQEYLKDHFLSYQNADNDSLKSLDYELEYILVGNGTDRDNLKIVMDKMLSMRTLLNLISLSSDSKSMSEARNLAISFVGFTGMPALIGVVQSIIMTVWAFAESIVDVAGLFAGKSIPMIKKSMDFQLELPELILFSKELIREKVKGMKEVDTSSQLSYQNYLDFFLLLVRMDKKSFRTMDLIQENIQLKYEDSFYMKNCLTGFLADASFRMEPKFVMFPFVRELLNNTPGAYYYSIRKEYSY